MTAENKHCKIFGRACKKEAFELFGRDLIFYCGAATTNEFLLPGEEELLTPSEIQRAEEICEIDDTLN